MSDLHFDPQTAKPTREAWLERAVEVFRPRFDEIGFPLPERIHVSVGFGHGAKAENKVILGQTWARCASADEINHLFIAPTADDPAEVLRILLHELIHVALDNEDGHRKRFAEAATRLGFEGPMTVTPAGVELAMELVVLAAELGEFPHAKLTPARTDAPVPAGGVAVKPHSGPATQTNRYHKVICVEDGYTARIAAKWIAAGLPGCGICGERMTEA